MTDSKKKYSNYQFNCSLILIFLSLISLMNSFSLVNAKEGEDFTARFRKISNELRCPTCQGLSVNDSEAGFSKSIKNKILKLMNEGKSDKEILAYFEGFDNKSSLRF